MEETLKRFHEEGIYFIDNSQNPLQGMIFIHSHTYDIIICIPSGIPNHKEKKHPSGFHQVLIVRKLMFYERGKCQSPTTRILRNKTINLTAKSNPCFYDQSTLLIFYIFLFNNLFSVMEEPKYILTTVSPSYFSWWSQEIFQITHRVYISISTGLT